MMSALFLQTISTLPDGSFCLGTDDCGRLEATRQLGANSDSRLQKNVRHESAFMAAALSLRMWFRTRFGLRFELWFRMCFGLRLGLRLGLRFKLGFRQLGANSDSRFFSVSASASSGSVIDQEVISPWLLQHEHRPALSERDSGWRP